MENIFEFEGFALLSDLDSDILNDNFLQLEQMQIEHFEKGKNFRSSDYIWPLEPLYTWSRVWEYPFCYYHINKFIAKNSNNNNLKIADIGSGVTFFPFALARLGCDVVCFDIDPVVQKDIPISIETISPKPGSIDTVIIEPGKKYNIENNTFDIVYCISVLEHIPDFEETINEIYRILKPNGIFILTLDIDLRGDYELGVKEFEKLKFLLNNKFENTLQTRLTHPAGLLTTFNSKYKWIKSFSKQMKLNILNSIGKKLFKKKYIPIGQGEQLYLGIYANVLIKK